MTVFQNGFSFCRILKKFQVIKFTLWIYNFKKKKRVIPNKNSKLIVSRNILLVINIFIYHGSSHRRCSVKNVFLKILLNWQEHTCARVSFLIKLQAYFIKKRLFSCEFCEIFKNTFFIEHPRATDATLKKKFKNLQRNDLLVTCSSGCRSDFEMSLRVLDFKEKYLKTVLQQVFYVKVFDSISGKWITNMIEKFRACWWFSSVCNNWFFKVSKVPLKSFCLNFEIY